MASNLGSRSGRPAGRTLWALLAAIILVPLLVFTGAAAVSYRNQFADASERLQRFLDVVHEHAVKVFETHELAAGQVNAMLDQLGDESIIAQQEPLNAKLKLLIERLPQVGAIWVLDETGHPLLSSNFVPAPRNLDLSDRAYFTVHRDGRIGPGATYISEILQGRANPGVRFFQLTKRRDRAGRFAGVIAVSIRPDYFENFYQQAARSGFDAVGLIRADGSILARYPPREDMKLRLSPTSGLMRAVVKTPDAGNYETVSDVDGVERLMAYRRLPGESVYLTVGVDRARILANWRASLATHMIYGVPATLGLGVLALVAMRRTRREADALARLAAETLHRAEIEEQLRHSQKMEAIGQLTGGIAHDFNNLLQIAIGSLDILKRRLPNGDPRSRDLVESALDGMTRAASLTQRLLAYARRQPLDPKTVDVNHLVQNVSELLRSTLGETVRIETVLAGGLWPAYVDANQLESAIVNLAVNARDAMPHGGRLTVETGNAHLDDSYTEQNPDVMPGQYVLVSITDTGTGMTPEVIAKAFEPFFTTKPAGQGTGLGLSQVYGFVKQSGGHVKIYSETGSGTAVKLYLPRRYGHEALGEIHHDRVPAPAAANSAAILVVEDEDGVRHFVCGALRDLGYRVVEASSGRQALELLRTHPEVGLLLSDVVMPEMNGRDLADLALAQYPELRVMFMTGYTRNAIVHNGVLDPQMRLISKPFTVTQLAAKVKEAFGEELAEAPAAARSLVPDGPLRILVVDDEPLVSLGLVDLLEGEGHAVIEASSAQEAIDRLTHENFDVVVTDHTMPGMTGSELARVIRSRWPGVGIVLSSGHVDLPGADIARLPRLDKPYRVDQVRKAVDQAICRH
ncbi:response regulator [Blastochloris sulfoviridis]|uniref:histidine kinase n=1 Tax=Blastochloris sulfoviridis TaxID=50712 RepID=A0A5M6HKC3_9HYPH|nr:response regulator [Blastochloris sulfoviridis]KAA5596281.1 response regulator [Blastochloris sulfoviridis]